jgi:hypothetical protein
MLDQELRFYEAHRTEWAAKHPGKYALVKGASLIGVFDSLESALAEGARHFGSDSFLARSVDEPPAPVSIPAFTAGVLHAGPPSAVPGHGRPDN